MTHPQEGGTGGEVSEILFFSAKSKRRPSLIYSMQIIPVCLSIVARRKGVFATRRGGLNWTPISLLVGHPCKLFHSKEGVSGGLYHFLRLPPLSGALTGSQAHCEANSHGKFVIRELGRRSGVRSVGSGRTGPYRPAPRECRWRTILTDVWCHPVPLSIQIN